MEIKNAIIESTSLGNEDHGIMTVWLCFNYEGFGQSFGGYSLDNYDEKKDKRIGTAYGCEFIKRILEVVGVEKWEDLKGKHIRVKTTPEKVLAIGNIIEDKWFDPEELVKEIGIKCQ